MTKKNFRELVAKMSPAARAEARTRTEAMLAEIRAAKGRDSGLVYLFLDFDGVLHKAGGQEPPFSHVDALAKALSDFPAVLIVISSSWRELYPLDALLDMCGPLAPRVVGVTPILLQSDSLGDGRPRVRLRASGQAPRVYVPMRASWTPTRYDEILTWLELSRRKQARWIAIDDQRQNFPPDLENVIYTGDVGFLAARHLIALRERLRSNR